MTMKFTYRTRHARSAFGMASPRLVARRLLSPVRPSPCLQAHVGEQLTCSSVVVLANPHFAVDVPHCPITAAYTGRLPTISAAAAGDYSLSVEPVTILVAEAWSLWPVANEQILGGTARVAVITS